VVEPTREPFDNIGHHRLVNCWPVILAASQSCGLARRYLSAIRAHAYGSLVLVASYAQLGRFEEARSALAEMRTLPGGSAKAMRWYLDRYSDPVAREHMAEGLRKAGVPEQ
jgi:pentatricopeptide repeat protein